MLVPFLFFVLTFFKNAVKCGKSGGHIMTKDCLTGLEKLERRELLVADTWFVDAIKATETIGYLTTIQYNKPVVAIVDSGLDINHTEFKNNLWNNPYDQLDGIDNDKNGYVDDINGWDFVQNDGTPQDGLFHGTHVAGIVSQIVKDKAQIMPLRFQNDNGLGYAGAAASSIHYAVDMKLKGVNIVAINCSFGGLDSMPSVLETAIKRANDNGIVVVMAAGNNATDMDLSPKYPGSLKLSNSLTVAAINPDMSLANYSNYGKNSVDVGAPGSSIYSSLPNNTYGYVSGSSMAAPVVSATVALLKTLGNYSASQIKNAILQGSFVAVSWVDKIRTGFIDILNSYNILKLEKPQDIKVVEQPKSEVTSPVKTISYAFDTVSSRTIRGWAKLSDSGKAIVEIYINKKLRYRVVADAFRNDTGRKDGFVVSINRKFLTQKSNQLEIRIKDSLGRVNPIVFKKLVNR